MNRQQRRAIGFTESRFRKMDVEANGFNPQTVNPFHSYSRSEAYKLADSIGQRTQRLDGLPRRWQDEKVRKELEKVDRLLSHLTATETTSQLKMEQRPENKT